MGEVGLLSEDDLVELIEGEIVGTAQIITWHLVCGVALTHLLAEASGGRYAWREGEGMSAGEINAYVRELRGHDG